MVPLTLRAFALPQLAANSTALLPNVATCAVSGTIFGTRAPQCCVRGCARGRLCRRAWRCRSGCARANAADARPSSSPPRCAGLGSLGEYVDVPAAALAASAASLAAPPAARLAHRLPVSTQKLAFAAAMLCSAPAVAFKPQLQAAIERDEAEVPPPPTSSVLELPSAPRAAYFVALGACVGGASGVMGIGAGTLMTLGLALGGLPSHKAVLGTSFVAQVSGAQPGASLASAGARARGRCGGARWARAAFSSRTRSHALGAWGTTGGTQPIGRVGTPSSGKFAHGSAAAALRRFCVRCGRRQWPRRGRAHARRGAPPRLRRVLCDGRRGAAQGRGEAPRGGSRRLA